MDKENKITFLLFLKYLLNLTNGIKNEQTFKIFYMLHVLTRIEGMWVLNISQVSLKCKLNSVLYVFRLIFEKWLMSKLLGIFKSYISYICALVVLLLYH